MLGTRFYDAVEKGAPADSVALRRAEFLGQADRFEARDIVDAARICRYFGKDASKMYAQVNTSFRYLNAHLKMYQNKDITKDFIVRELNDFEKLLYRLLYELEATSHFWTLFSSPLDCESLRRDS